MTKSKPKGPTPSLIGGSNGKPKRAAAGRRCECSRCHAPIVMGQGCIDIPQAGGTFSSSRRVCDECFKKILEKSQNDLEELKNI